MLRPRLILDLERRMPEIIASGEMTEIYRALKVYLLLGKQGETTDDDAIKAWFAQSWRAGISRAGSGWRFDRWAQGASGRDAGAG
jgi:type VI protein secretion system component VasK